MGWTEITDKVGQSLEGAGVTELPGYNGISSYIHKFSNNHLKDLSSVHFFGKVFSSNYTRPLRLDSIFDATVDDIHDKSPLLFPLQLHRFPHLRYNKLA